MNSAARPRLTRLEAWGLTAVVLLVAAFVWHDAPIAFLGTGFLVVSLAVGLWERFALRRVSYRRELAERRAFFGEELPLTIEIVNRKLLPLPLLRADDNLPAGLELIDGPARFKVEAGRTILHQLVSLGWYERLRLRYRLRCAARGAYVLGPVTLRTGDPFGFVEVETTLPLYDRLLVYPRIVPVERLGLPSLRPFGDARDPRRLFEDVSRAAGVRPYTPQDSQRHIHWKASARTQQLQTRIYEPTASHTLMLYVNLASFEGYWWASLNREALELAILTASSVAAWGLEQGYHVGVTTNGAPAGLNEELAVAPAGDPEQLVRILEALARISLFARTPLEQMLERDRTRLPWGTTVVVVSAVVPEAVLRVLGSLRANGHTPALLRIGRARGAGRAFDGAAPLAGITSYTIADDLAWDAVETLHPSPTAA